MMGKGMSLFKYMDENKAEIDWDSHSREPETEYDEDEEEKILRVPMELIAESCDNATYNKRKTEYYKEHLEEVIEEFKDLVILNDGNEIELDDNVKKKVEDKLNSEFNENTYSDDYCPIWNTIWEFPSGYEAETLNDFDIAGLVFFDIKTDYRTNTFVGLTCCGMDMSPSLYYAFLKYSDLDFNRTELIRECGKKGWDYCKQVIGQVAFKDFILILTKGMSKSRITELSKEGREEFAGFLAVASAFAMIPDIKDVVDGKEGAVEEFKRKRDGLTQIVDEYVNRKDEVKV